jgi:KipI family sensor histidine kinase inhibitor
MRQLGDAAVLLDVDGGHREAQALARSIRACDVVPGATTVGVIGPAERLLYEASTRRPMTHEIPIVFDGEDLESLGLSTAEVARDLGGRELEVAWLGFMPGFAYLVGLPDRYSQLVRRASPRTQVPAGAFAVAGGYAGIYPVASPGGWNLLGRTNVKCFDPEEPPHALFQPGDHVRLVATDSLDPLPPRSRRPLAGSGLEVLEAGPLLMMRISVGKAPVRSVCLEPERRTPATSGSQIRRSATSTPQLPSSSPRQPGCEPLKTCCWPLWAKPHSSSTVPGCRRARSQRPERARLRLRRARERETGTTSAPTRDRRTGRGRSARARGDVGGRLAERSNRRAPESRRRRSPRRPFIARRSAEAVESHAVVPGAIQIPPSGGPVGGYPVAATVITGTFGASAPSLLRIS